MSDGRIKIGLKINHTLYEDIVEVSVGADGFATNEHVAQGLEKLAQALRKLTIEQQAGVMLKTRAAGHACRLRWDEFRDGGVDPQVSTRVTCLTHAIAGYSSQVEVRQSSFVRKDEALTDLRSNHAQAEIGCDA